MLTIGYPLNHWYIETPAKLFRPSGASGGAENTACEACVADAKANKRTERTGRRHRGRSLIASPGLNLAALKLRSLSRSGGELLVVQSRIDVNVSEEMLKNVHGQA